MTQTNQRVEELLKELYHAGNSFLEEYPWEFEQDRWMELLVCSLIVEQLLPPENAREAVETLKKMDLVSVDVLSALTPDTSAFLSRVLVQFGCAVSSADAAVKLLSSLANSVKTRWGGYIQRFLREHGHRMVGELGDALKSGVISENTSRKIALVWLQNVANIPVLLSADPYVKSFCAEHKLSEEDLVSTADRLGLNVSVLDDLLALEAVAASQTSSKKEPKKMVAKAGSRA